MLWILPNWRTSPKINKLDTRSSPLFTMVHHSSLTAYLHGITISLVGFTWACPMLRSAWEMLSSHQDSMLRQFHVRIWIDSEVIWCQQKVNPNSYHQLVTIWIRINSSYLKLLTHSSDANWPSQGSAFSSVLIQQPEMDVCCFLGVFQPWARGQGLLILPQLGPTVEKAVLPNSHT